MPPTDAEIEQLAADLRPILDSEIALFAEIEDNDAVNAGIEATGGVRNKIYGLYEKRL